MSSPGTLTIDLSEEFAPLANPPIVEAVIELQARPSGDWNEDVLRAHLASQLPNYPDLRSQREFTVAARVDLQSAGSAEQFRRDTWSGVRATSADKLHIAQFRHDRFVFSRLAPYQDWRQFCAEALRLWSIHSQLANPTEIQRIGVRFINRIDMPRDEFRLDDFLRNPPQPPRDLEVPVLNYLYQDTFTVPGHAYSINRVQTIQPPAKDNLTTLAAILDVDVFTTHPCEPIIQMIETRLAEMRWLKDKVFFGSVTKKALRSFRKGSR